MRSAVLIVAVLIGMCAAPAAAQTPGPVPVPEVPPDPAVTVFVDEPAILNAYPTRPQAYSRVPDDRSVRLYFTSGTPECFGATATVEETADDVVVTLHSGTMPHAVDRACILIALVGAIDVPLQHPLGSRTVHSAT
ncbi:hypothetical protein [Mycobacterium sp. SMC-4]|uniref:hypothetical protein n=1 Tax=Mycobacterium sp. SMC-4 TaxID=2857059 RepID=UPI0021B16F6F|nr:hypothetical protein [Mycobacterium sp. SMC-4]UXA17921.1 hypothetical protein KXD98_25115 [Mycobacterium sp. SMC-4]